MNAQYPTRNIWKIVTIFLGVIVLVESFILYNAVSSITGSFDLPSYSFSDGGDYVSAYGSWVSDTVGGDSLIATIHAINSTTIECDQARGICIEARAYTDKEIVDNRILTQCYEYKIKSWTPQEIIAVWGGPVATYEIRIDRVKKVVTIIEAEVDGVRSLPAYAHLGNGDDAIEAAKKR